MALQLSKEDLEKCKIKPSKEDLRVANFIKIQEAGRIIAVDTILVARAPLKRKRQYILIDEIQDKARELLMLCEETKKLKRRK